MSRYETNMGGVSQSISQVVVLVRAGEFTSKISETAYHLWNIQGYLQHLTLGSPGVEPLSNDTPGEIRAKLQLQDLVCLESVEAQQFGAEAKAINVVQIFTLAKMIFDALKALGIFDKNKDVTPQAEPQAVTSKPAKKSDNPAG